MKVVIVGAGISGLTTAYALLNSSQFDVTVYEADSRPGGKIWSDKTDGFLCEKGVNGFLDNKPKTLQLCGYLGLEPLKSSDNARRRFIFSSGKLNQLSESPLSFLKSDLISWHGKLRIIYELIAPKGPEDETVADFVIRRLGKESLEKLIDPMCSGIFAGDPYKMSIRHCFPRIKELEQNYGSLIRAMIKLQKERRKGSGVRGQGSEDKTPIIYFVGECAGLLEEIKTCGADVIGIDWRINIDDAIKRLGSRFSVQGNLDPCALFLPKDKIRERIKEVLNRASFARGHIFNLGHGVLPETPVENVAAMVEMVHRLSRK